MIASIVKSHGFKAMPDQCSGDDAQTTPRRDRPSKDKVRTIDALWAPIGCYFAIASIAFLWSGFRLTDPSALGACAEYAIGGLIARACGERGLRPRLALMTCAISQIGAISTAGMMLTYAAAALDRPMIDGQLLQFDQLIGYSWRNYASWAHSDPMLMTSFTHAYAQMLAMPLIAVMVLSVSGDAARIRQYIVATAIALAAGITMFALWPAVTAWSHIGTSPGYLRSYPLLPTAHEGWIRDLLEIRAGRGLDVPRFGSGLIAFPSFHCIFGILFAWAVWTRPKARIPALVASGATIASAPIIGGHYLADLTAGVMVAALSIPSAIWIEHRFVSPER